MRTLDEDNKPVWLERGICQTNPVHVAEQFADHLKPRFQDDLVFGSSTARDLMAKQLHNLAHRGGRVPEFALEAFIRDGALAPGFRLEIPEHRPGVLGLVVDRNSSLKLVLPLRPERGPWRIEPSLPFNPEALQDTLVRLVHAVDMPTAGVIPERLGYTFKNPLGQRVKGNSMTVAALLAVLDEVGGRSASVFHAVCALVEPLADGRLEPVERGADKLEAALRECERLSLIVCHPNFGDLSRFDPQRLGIVWRVDSLAGLAAKLHKAEVLAPLFKCSPLQRAEAARVRDRLRWLVQQENKFRDASDLGVRLQGCDRVMPVEPAVWTDIGRLCAEASRHYGQFSEALRLGRQIWGDVIAQGVLASDDEEADAAAEYAASLFDNHQFDEIPPLLEHWAADAVGKPRCFRPLTRVKVWNTLARGLVILGRDGWESLFQNSLELNRRLNDQENVKRTLNYLVHGLVRSGRAAEAEAVLGAAGLRRDPLPPPNPWDGFALANAARCAGLRWYHPELEQAAVDTEWPKHAFGFYFQATARQPHREGSDAAKRFLRAAEFMRAEAGEVDCNICILFALFLELAAATQAGDLASWTASIQAIRRFLDTPDAVPLRDYYLSGVEQLAAAPDAEATERLLRLVPYF